MTFLFRCLVLTLAAFGVSMLVASVAVALHWWRQRPTGSAARRADALLSLRLVPGSIGLAVGLFAVVGLWRFESREADEFIGWTLGATATLGAVFVVLFLARLVLLQVNTRRLLSVWLSDAQPIVLPGVTVPAFRINTSFPVVAVIGIIRPTLVVDRCVLDACTNPELSAILAHEQGHLRRWDNLRRALFAATPDLLGWTSVGPALLEEWRTATEEAADDVAAAGGADARLHLAHALLRVARLAPAHTDPTGTSPQAFRQSQLPASALYRGESVEHRVRRLCAASPLPSRSRSASTRVMTRVVATAALIGTALGSLAVQQHIHDLMERLVASLP